MISCHQKDGNLSITSTDPVFKIDYANPTADKPQSKLWYQNGSWWVILPRSERPSLWERTDKGWKEHIEIAGPLQGVPGRADVWADSMGATAVGVAEHTLTVYKLSPLNEAPTVLWKSKILVQLFPPDINSFIETATIVKDRIGDIFVAAVVDAKVYVWSSSDSGEKWTMPVALSENLDKDDICVITPLCEGVGVIWSDQVREAVLMREHIEGKPLENWEAEEVIDIGRKTADDHLNTCLASDHTLWVATKNSVDSIGKPQLVLRIRSADGKWKNLPYANMESNLLPTRPIVIVTEDNTIAFTGFSNNSTGNSNIIFSVIDTTLTDILKNPQVVISPDTTYKSFVNNVTGPRHPFPMNVPWIILASDQEGRVYEYDLRKLVFGP